MLDIKKSREICDAATPGLWQQDREYVHNPENGFNVAMMRRRHDAEFIAHARAALPEALNEIERLLVLLAAAPCWCNDCEYGRIYEEGICCENPDSEMAGEWTGTYDSCQYCKQRGPQEKEATP